MNDNGIKSLDEIWAELDVDDGPSDAPAEAQVAPILFDDDDTDQPNADDFVPAKLSDLYAEADDDNQPEEGVVDLDQEIALPNGQRATVKDLWESGLRLDDYTRKTQEVAETRRLLEAERQSFESEKAQLEAARSLKQALLDDPNGTVARMAVELGIIDEDTAEYASRRRYSGDPNALIPGGDKKPEVDIEALIEQKAAEKFEELMKSSPVAKQIEIQQARQTVDAIFGQIEQTYGTQLDVEDRKIILQESLNMNQDNLEYVFLKLNSELQRRQANKDRVHRGQGNRSVRSTQPNDADVVSTAPESFEEAWRRVELKYA